MLIRKSCITASLFVLVVLSVQPVKADQGEGGAQQKTPAAQSSIQPPSATAESPVNGSNVRKVVTPAPKPEGNSEARKGHHPRRKDTNWDQRVALFRRSLANPYLHPTAKYNEGAS